MGSHPQARREVIQHQDKHHKMPTYGVYERATPILRVLRGELMTLPSQRSQRHAPKAGQDIKSAMLISYDISDDAWVKGMSDGSIPYLAREDDTEYDVLASGVLTGLSLADPVRVQTGFFDAGTYAIGTPVTWSTGTAGNIKEAATTDTIIGYVASPGKVDISGEVSGVTKTDGQILVVTFDAVFNRTASL